MKFFTRIICIFFLALAFGAGHGTEVLAQQAGKVLNSVPKNTFAVVKLRGSDNCSVVKVRSNSGHVTRADWRRNNRYKIHVTGGFFGEWSDDVRFVKMVKPKNKETEEYKNLAYHFATLEKYECPNQ